MENGYITISEEQSDQLREILSPIGLEMSAMDFHRLVALIQLYLNANDKKAFISYIEMGRLSQAGNML